MWEMFVSLGKVCLLVKNSANESLNLGDLVLFKYDDFAN